MSGPSEVQMVEGVAEEGASPDSFLLASLSSYSIYGHAHLPK